MAKTTFKSRNVTREGPVKRDRFMKDKAMNGSRPYADIRLPSVNTSSWGREGNRERTVLGSSPAPHMHLGVYCENQILDQKGFR